MASSPDPKTSLEALLAAAARGEPLSGEVARHLRPDGVMGALAQMPLTEILQNMDFGKRSVRVDVWLDDADGTVHVHDGQIVFAHATTAAGTTQGEAAVLELCRRSGGFFGIRYVREDIDRNVHRPTTFVLLEALRVIDESAPRAGAPAAVDLGLGPIAGVGASHGADLGMDPWGDGTGSAAFGDMGDELGNAFPPPMADEDGGAALNDPSAVLDIEVDAETGPVAVRDLRSQAQAQAALAVQQSPRYRVGAVIHVFTGDAMMTMLLEDIGRGGAFLRTDAPPARASIVTLRLPASDGAIDLPARVVHVLDRSGAASVAREPGIGVQFEGLAPVLAARLGAFVEGLGGAPTAGGASASASPRDRLLGLVAESEFLVAAGDLENAQRVLSRAQGLAPEDDEVRRKLLNVNEAIDAARANAFLEQAMRGGPQAVELARRATQLRPVRDVLLRSLAVFARGGAHDEVADVAEQLLELDPDDEGALRTLLDANIAMRRWTVAVRAVESLLRLRPQDEQLQATLQRVVGLARRSPG